MVFGFCCLRCLSYFSDLLLYVANFQLLTGEMTARFTTHIHALISSSLTRVFTGKEDLKRNNSFAAAVHISTHVWFSEMHFLLAIL